METLPPKERILHTAIYLFARYGFAGTGLREITTKAEVNLAMINYFFGSKKGLLKEIVSEFFMKYLSIARRELEGVDSLNIKLTRFIRSTVYFFDSERDALLVTITELPHDDPEIIEHKASWARQMALILEKEICRPLEQETGKEILATCIGPMLTSLMASRFLFAPIVDQVRDNIENPMSLDSYIEMICTLFLQGLITQDTSVS